MPPGDRLTVVGADNLDRPRPGSSERPRLGARAALARLAYEQTTVAESARSADLVHLCDARPLLLSAAPFIITVHDVTFVDHPEWMPENVALYKRTMLQAALLRRPRAILCDSQHTRRRLEQGVPGARRLKIDVVYLGVDQPVRSRWQPVESDPYFLTLSTVEPRKNHMTLLAAYRELRRAGYPLRWKVAGSAGHLSAPILAALRAQDGVDVMDYVSSEQRESLFAGAMFFALPSIEEGFGFPVLEAMARGVPAACSTGSALDEVVGADALRVDPTDVGGWVQALSALADDSVLRGDLSTRGRAGAERFSWEATARQVVHVYDEVRDSVEQVGHRSVGRSLAGRSPRQTSSANARVPELSRQRLMTVLCVDRATEIAPAQRSVLDVVSRLDSMVSPNIMCPAGPFADLARGSGVPIIGLPGEAGGRDVGQWPSLRAAVADIASSAAAVRRAAAAIQADVVHANSIRAGLSAGAARRLGGPPTIVDLHGALPARSAALLRPLLNATVDAVVSTIDSPAGGLAQPRSPQLTVADAAAMSKHEARAELGIPPELQLVGVIAQITPWKGQDTAVRALKLLSARRPSARLLLVGGTGLAKQSRYDDVGFERWLYRLVRGLGLESRVEFWGAREDLPTITRALDVLLAPSWEERLGRSVITAMALETAVIATNVGSPAAYIDHGVDGLLLPPRVERLWAVALERLLRDAPLREAMAKQGVQRFEHRFGPDDSVSAALELYDQLLEGPARLPGRGDRADRPQRFRRSTTRSSSDQSGSAGG